VSNTTLTINGPSARIAALNVVAVVLGKNFAGAAAYHEEKDFYERL
jgi:hypothetical protein